MTFRTFCVFGLVLVASTTAAHTQDVSTPVLQEMQPGDRMKCGLHKLSDVEMRNLDQWIQQALLAQQRRFTKAALANLIQPHPTAAGVVESHIDDDFEGWSGDTIFKLRNGQIWQQSSYAYTYHYAYAPEVTIYPSGAVYKMKVDGVDDVIEVRRLK